MQQIPRRHLVDTPFFVLLQSLAPLVELDHIEACTLPGEGSLRTSSKVLFIIIIFLTINLVLAPNLTELKVPSNLIH